MSDIVIIGTPIEIVEPPVSPVVTAQELAAWLKLPNGIIEAETPMLEAQIAVATEIVENYTWLTLRETTFNECFPEKYQYLHLEKAPITAMSSITEIRYLDSDYAYSVYPLGAAQSGGSYANLDIRLSELGQAYLNLHKMGEVVFASTTTQYPIKVQYKAGYPYDGGTDKYILPQSLRSAILMLASKYYTDRGDCIGCVMAGGCLMPAAVKVLLDGYALRNIALGGERVDYRGTPYQKSGVV